MKPSTLRRGMNLWPPFLFSGIHVAAIADDWRSARVELRMRPWNRNYVRTHYGGNLFSMTDPFWMIMTLQSLGRDYIVWDRAGSIDFLKPGKGTVAAEFRLDDAVLDAMRSSPQLDVRSFDDEESLQRAVRRSSSPGTGVPPGAGPA